MNESNNESKIGIGLFLLKSAWAWGTLSLIAAVVLYMVSYNSLKTGLWSSNAVSEQNSGLLALAFNLLEIVGIVWIFVGVFSGDSDEDSFLDLFVKFTLGAILVGDIGAIFYATGYTTNLPGNTFGNALTIILRAVGAIIGGAGSETFLILGALIIWVWFQHKRGKKIVRGVSVRTNGGGLQGALARAREAGHIKTPAAATPTSSAHPAPAPIPAPTFPRPAPKPMTQPPFSSPKPEPTHHWLGFDHPSEE